jgi:hypothetical protein
MEVDQPHSLSSPCNRHVFSHGARVLIVRRNRRSVARRIEAGAEFSKGLPAYVQRCSFVRIQARQQLVGRAALTSSPRRAAFIARMIFALGMGALLAASCAPKPGLQGAQ